MDNPDRARKLNRDLQPEDALGVAGIKGKRFLNRQEAAEFLGLSPQTLANYSWRGEGPPFIRISDRCVRYDRDELLAWMKAKEVRPANASATGSAT